MPIDDHAADLDDVRRSLELPAAFAGVFDRHFDAVHRYLHRRAGADIADELAAETFLVAFEGRRRFVARDGVGVRPWLYGIATNLLRRHVRDEVRQYRAWARTGVDPVAVECPDDRIVARLDAEAWSGSLAGALAGPRKGDREVLLLFAWGELSYAEIAEALAIPVGTVRSRLSRARANVRSVLVEGDQS
jgi:RNA polymerase sigma factor (sigma-70 family)